MAASDDKQIITVFSRFAAFFRSIQTQAEEFIKFYTPIGTKNYGEAAYKARLLQGQEGKGLCPLTPLGP